MGKIVIFSNEVSDKLDEIAEILYKNHYFGFVEDADLYVEKIHNYIYDNIDKPISKFSPENFQKFGKHYIKYKANENINWYIFFDRKDNRFLINHILNNHSTDFPELL
ncbi:MAG: hypothetical protein KA796_01350 [Chryseobacterium sp.]|nr:hypothetical protein [Chryseobacterium sp.]